MAITRRHKRVRSKTRRKKNIKVPPLSKSIKPGDNFYKYVNSYWLDSTHLPTTFSSYGVSEEVDKVIYDKLIKKIHDLPQSPSNPHEKALRIFFSSGRYSNYHHEHDKTFKKLLASLGCISSAETIMATMGKFLRQKIPTHLTVYLGRDLLLPNKNVAVLSTGSLSLPNISYYKGTAPGKTTIMRLFESMLTSMGKQLEYDDFGKVVHLENAAIDEFSAPDIPYMTTGEKLANKYRHIPWASFWSSYGVAKNEWKSMAIMNYCDTWLKWLNKQMEKPIINDWITWFRVHATLYFASLLKSPIDNLYFNFYRSKLRGDKEKRPQEQLLYLLACNLLVPSMTHLYKSCCLSDEHQADIRHFVKDVRHSAAQHANSIEWLSPKSRTATINKINKMDLEIVNLDRGKHYELPLKALSEIDIVHNIIVLGEAMTKRDIYYILNSNVHDMYGDIVFEVNAHYSTSGNRLIIPGGITLWPYYDKERLGWSYGGLGAVVGHELLHAFDEEGKDYDPNGIYRPWWTSKDLKTYNKKTNALIKLFSNTKFLGHFVNGKSTLSENIADLGGLAIALSALKHKLHDAPAAVKQKEIRDFFISYAISWRTKERREQSIYRLFTDVHAPAELRVNLIVTQFADFYETFNVKPGDDLYIDPKDRIMIF